MLVGASGTGKTHLASAFGKEGAELLFQIISEFYEQKSLIITSNLEFS
ncbi:ATP-binding protein [Solibacillus isronensis]